MSKYKEIAKYYEECFEKHKGNRLLECDWENNEEAVSKRYSVFWDFSFGRLSKVQQSVLDFGCATGTVYSKLPKSMTQCYNGIDISAKMIKEAKKRYPDGNFICQDILEKDLEQSYDYILCNGVFTECRSLNKIEMLDFVRDIIIKLWKKTDRGLAFNLMDTHRISFKDRRPELFFMNYEEVMVFLIEPLSPSKWAIENYGLNDFLIKVWK